MVGDLHKGRKPMIKGLVRALWWLSREIPNPELNPDLGPFFTHLRLQEGKDPRDLPPEVWEAYVADAIVNAIVDAWDRHGAPSVAKSPTGGYIGSAEGPGGDSSSTPRAKGEPTKRPGGNGYGASWPPG
jgi:hypothetical protein